MACAAADSGPGRQPGADPEDPSGTALHQPAEQPRLVDLFALGTACAICIIGAGGIGYLLDSACHTQPWLTFAGLAFGVVSAVLLAIARVRRYL